MARNYSEAEKDNVRDSLLKAISQTDKAARDQDESTNNYWEFVKPWTIKDPEKKARVYRSYKANHDPVPREGDSTWDLISRHRQLRALRRAYTHGHAGSPQRPGNQNIPEDSWSQYYSTQEDMQAGPHPEFNENPIIGPASKRNARARLRDTHRVLDEDSDY